MSSMRLHIVQRICQSVNKDVHLLYAVLMAKTLATVSSWSYAKTACWRKKLHIVWIFGNYCLQKGQYHRIVC